MNTHGQHIAQNGRLGLGCAPLSRGYHGRISDSDALAVLDTAFACGMRHWDTADVYGAGQNERLLARALRGRREQIFLATKSGWLLPNQATQGTPMRTNWQTEGLRVSGRPDYLREALHASLRRLQVDVLDLYYHHFPDPEVPIEDTVGAMAELVREGKTKAIGLSNVDVSLLRRAHAVHPIAAVQNEYSLWHREPEAEMLAETAALDIHFVAWAPLGGGFLAGTQAALGELDQRRFQPRYQPDALERNRQSFAPLLELAQELEITQAQLALAWLLQKQPHVIPIAGARRSEHVAENLQASTLQLPDQILATIDRLMPHGTTSGAGLK